MILRTILIFSVFNLFFFSAICQDYLWEDAGRIKQFVIRDVDSTSKITLFPSKIIRLDSWYSKRKLANVDTIIYSLKVSIDGSERSEKEYYFDTSEGFSRCDSVVIKYYCCKCAEKQIDSFMNWNFWNSKQIATDVYLSTTNWVFKSKSGNDLRYKYAVPKMVIKRTSEETICTTIIFTTLMMTKRDWKRLKRDSHKAKLQNE